MALVRALLDGGATDLEVVAFLGSVEVELLLAAGAVRRLHTAGTGLDALGLAPRYRAAREQGAPEVVEWSEGSLHAAIEAAARALPSLPCTTAPTSAVVAANPHLTVAADPFTGVDVVVARALPVDVALLHVPAVDAAGNLFIDGDEGLDGLLARAAARTVATAATTTDRPPREAAIPRIWVDAVTVVADGAWPTASHPGEALDTGAVQGWARAKGADPALLRRQEPAA